MRTIEALVRDIPAVFFQVRAALFSYGMRSRLGVLKPDGRAHILNDDLLRASRVVIPIERPRARMSAFAPARVMQNGGTNNNINYINK
ncbi:MAG: hypothetical protein Q8K18_19635 [Burkholderiales bacterium]|nr:hypothetical protein [Burkholderiales bacterium]